MPEVSTREFVGRVDSYDNDTVGGWIIDPSDSTHNFDVDLYVDGAWCGRVRAGFPRADLEELGIGSGRNAFYFALPSSQHDESVKIEVKEAASGHALDASMVLPRTISSRHAGLSSGDAIAMLYKPLLEIGADAICFQGNHITIKGMYLPPGGDPFAYEVIGDHGVSFVLHRPLQAEGTALDHFWFWPNAAWGMWKIDIDLALTSHKGTAYRFVFKPKGDYRKDSTEVLYVPKDLGLWQQLPDYARRNFSQFESFPEAGPLKTLTQCQAIAALAQRHIKTTVDSRVLDWGCGWGSMTRAFADVEKCSELWGADIDEDNLAWARANISKATFTRIPLYPPTVLQANHFDLVYALSVMTRLTHKTQEKWLAEIRRVLRPGGCAIITFLGSTALACSTRYVSGQTMANVIGNGFDDAPGCQDFDYCKITFQTREDVCARWGRYLRIAEIVEAGIGAQDIAVLVKD